MTLAPSSAPTRYATARRAVGQACANPAGAAKWMPSRRRRGEACAPRPCVCRRAVSQGLGGHDRVEFRGQIALAVYLDNAVIYVFSRDNVVANADLNTAAIVCATQDNFGIGFLGQRVNFNNGRRGRQLRDQFVDQFVVGAVCSHNADNISWGLESVNRFFKKKSDFFGGWESGTYKGFYTKGAKQ